MKRVLFITYHFPPDAAVGAIRPAELTKYMPDFGWEPIVLSVNERYYERIDSSIYSNLSMEVVRTRKAGSINSIYMFLKQLLSGKGMSRLPTAKGKEWFTTNEKKPSRERLKSRLIRYYNSILIYLPDKEIGWFFFAVFKGLNLVRGKKIDAIFTTSPPHSVQLIGLTLKLFTKKPWIVDFRDPWEVKLKPRRSRSVFSDMIERNMEKAIVSNCDWVVSVTEPMTKRLKDLYPQLNGKFVTIPNGYDSTDLSKYLQEGKYKSFTITYVGSLYFGRNPFLFLTAISDLINEGRIERDAIRLRFIGDCRMSDGKSVEEMVEKIKLNEVVAFIDSVPHHEALKEIAKSHVLLLMAPCQPLQIPAKVYEYIGLKTSILAVCEDGATKDLMQAYPLARLVSPDSLSEMKEAIVSLYREGDQTETKKLCHFPFEKYERRTIAKEVSGLFNKATLQRTP